MEETITVTKFDLEVACRSWYNAAKDHQDDLMTNEELFADVDGSAADAADFLFLTLKGFAMS